MSKLGGTSLRQRRLEGVFAGLKQIAALTERLPKALEIFELNKAAAS